MKSIMEKITNQRITESPAGEQNLLAVDWMQLIDFVPLIKTIVWCDRPVMSNK